jgi:hypothetical protein
MKFKNFHKESWHPFLLVADFESTLKPVDIAEGSKTMKYQRHVANSFGVLFEVSDHRGVIKQREYTTHASDAEEDVIETFVKTVEKYAQKCYNLSQQRKTIDQLVWSDEQKDNFENCKSCERCCAGFSEKDWKVRHHCHVSGDFISTLCNACNFKLQIQKFVPVVIHNLKGYDSHLIIKGLAKYGYKIGRSDDFTCIPNTEQSYVSFSKMIKVGEYPNKDKQTKPIMYEIRFIDSFAFMATSLDKLSGNLRNKQICNCNKSPSKIHKHVCEPTILFDTPTLRKNFEAMSSEFPNDEHFLAMTEKGIYPYDYIDSYQRLLEKELPPIKSFYSKLSDCECKPEDYERGKRVYSLFKCQSLLDYHNLYLKTDVFLLADVWRNFRRTAYINYELDPAFYFTLPSLGWDAMLKKTKVKLELFTSDQKDMYELCENNIRGGISNISKRYAEANYDENKRPKSAILYYDANNLYPSAMIEKMPTGKFAWTRTNWTKEQILELDENGDEGFIFEVDLRIPKDKQKYFNGYIPCPELRHPRTSDLSHWQQKDYKEKGVKKLIMSFHDKQRYGVHYRYLRTVLELGVELVKVHRVLKFEQSNFFKEYVDLNTKLRKEAKNDFEKDLYKLMNNSVFGKSMENVRNRINFSLVTTEEEALRIKNLKEWTIFDEDLVGVHKYKTKIVLNKPIYLGLSILDESKNIMLNFHYNFMLKTFRREDIDLLMTDTDSLVYHIRGDTDPFEVMKSHKNQFDLSNYPVDHELYDLSNAKRLKKMKNEHPFYMILEFVGLRPKLYCLQLEGDEQKVAAKGTKRCVAKRLKIEQFKHTLYSGDSLDVNQNSIRSMGHDLYSITLSKTALSACDDKVYICEDRIHTIGHGFDPEVWADYIAQHSQNNHKRKYEEI